MSYTIAVPSSSIQKVLTYGIPSITASGSGVSVANGAATITSSYPSLPPVNDPAYAQANVATGIATSSYNQANTATNLAQTVYDFANTISGGSAVDNVARVLASSASSNTIIIQGVNITQNNNIIALNNYASGAYAKANAALANTSGILSGSLHITGALGVGTTYSGTTGEIRATNEVTAYFSSDERLKENIEQIDAALYKLRKVRGVVFDWKDEVIEKRGGEDNYFVRKHDTGVIAQEIEQVLPEVVAIREDGYKAVRYEKLAGLIIQAINELADEVDEIKQRLK
jgi:hypothetical protein